jgi:hypothetical protein
MNAFEILALVAAPLVVQLDHNDFRARERAQHQLSHLGVFAAPWIEAGMRGKPEIACRCRVVYGPIREKWIETFRPSRYPVFPWIDSLPNDRDIPEFTFGNWPPPMRAFLVCAQGQVGVLQEDKDFYDYRLATKMLVRHLARFWTKKKIVSLLDEMAEREVKTWGDKYKLPKLAAR